MTNEESRYCVREVCATEEDLLEECALLQKSCFGYDDIDVYSPKIIEQILGNKGGHLIMAFHEKQPVGFSIVGSHCGGSYHVFREGVARNHRNNQLGKRMRETLFSIGRNEKCALIDLTFSAHNLAAAFLNIHMGAATRFDEMKYKGKDKRLRGLPMDRLISIYDLNALRPTKNSHNRNISEWVLDEAGFHHVSSPTIGLLIPVKDQTAFESLPEAQLNHCWYGIRQAFNWAQDAGYYIDNVLSLTNRDGFAYVLQKDK